MRRSQIFAVYAAAFVHGLALVSFPASSAVLKGVLGLSDAQYGSIFLPQVALAIAGALGGAALVPRLGLRALLVLSLLALGASQLALAAALGAPESARYVTVCAGTALLGFGFGLGGAPLNGLAALLFTARRDTALVALHSLLGLGLSLGPLLVGALMAGGWLAYPLGLALTCAALALNAGTQHLPQPPPRAQLVRDGAMQSPARAASFWLLAAIAVLYAFAEGTFSNWTVVYLTEVKALPASAGGIALSSFWAALVVGRLGASVLVLRVPARRIWSGLPLLMILAFLLLPGVETPAGGIAVFALAGLACSAFFPLTIAIASGRFPQHVAWVSSMMIAALMAGVGLGSFVVGPLRAWLSMESLYQASAAYPAAALLLALLMRSPGRAATHRRPA